MLVGGRKTGRVCSAGRLLALEEKHFSLPNREGAVVYIVVKALHPPHSAELAPPRVALVSAQQKASLCLHLAVASPKSQCLSCGSKVYKWKNAWYILVRALREKFAMRVSEAAVAKRVREIPCHHPDEVKDPGIRHESLTLETIAHC